MGRVVWGCLGQFGVVCIEEEYIEYSIIYIYIYIYILYIWFSKRIHLVYCVLWC